MIRNLKIGSWIRRSPWLFGLCLVAILLPLLANDKPLVCKYQGIWYAPAFSDFRPTSVPYPVGHPLHLLSRDQTWKSATYDAAVFPLIPYHPKERDTKNIKVSPFGVQNTASGSRLRHWLGTDASGYDVAAGLFSGARVAITIGFLALLFAAIPGIFLGVVAGYFGDSGLRISRWHVFITLPILIISIVTILIADRYALSHGPDIWLIIKRLGALLAIFLLCAFGKFALPTSAWLKHTVALPTDLLIMRASEVTGSFPKLIILTVVIALLNRTPSLSFIAMLAGVLSWPGIASFVRAEMLRIRELDYIAAAKVSGLSDWRVMVRHALPNAMPPTYVALALFAAQAILLEASLSFLGIQNASEQTSWGRLMLDARLYPTAWWLAIFPGLMITMTMYALYRISMQRSSLHTPVQ